MKRSISFLLSVIAVVAGAFFLSRFFADNSEVVRLRFHVWQTKEVSLGYLCLFSFLAGLLLTSVFLVSNSVSKYFEAKRLRRENAALQKMLEMKEQKITDTTGQVAAHSNSSK